MICPHCHNDIRYRDRSDNVCGTCKREFALEPKASPFRLHDMRIGRLAAKLSDDGRLFYTYEQLRYAAGKRELGRDIEAGWRSVFWGTAGIILAVGLVWGAPFAFGAGVGGFGWSASTTAICLFGGVFGLMALSLIINGLRRPHMVRNERIDLGTAPEDFAAEVDRRWRAVYGSAPPHLVDERTVGVEQPAVPRYVVVSTDRSALVCLSANGLARTRAVAFAMGLDGLPPDIPVLVVHDASPAGLRLVGAARAQLGNRVVDVGISPRTALDSGEAMVWIRRPMLSEHEAAALPAALADDERAWFVIGWWAPVAAVPPRKLLAAVDRAIDRFEPDTAAARSIGFLTWPAA